MTTIKMTELTKALQDRGLKAEFTMSGGNCGTIYIGETDAEGNYEFAVGPSNHYRDEAQMEELCWGIDGAEDATYFFGDESEFTIDRVADVITKDYFDNAMFSCGLCGLARRGIQGKVMNNQGFIEFTCSFCQILRVS